MLAGLPVTGIGTVFYVVLLLGMGVTKLWRWGFAAIRRIGPGRLEKVKDTSLLTNSSLHRSRAPILRRYRRST